MAPGTLVGARREDAVVELCLGDAWDLKRHDVELKSAAGLTKA
jgi:hypothetical protein